MRLLGILYRFTEIKDINALRTYFLSAVMPAVEYCSPVWAGAADSNLNQLNSVLSFFSAIVRNRNPSLRYATKNEILETLRLLPFNTRRQVNDVRFLFQAINGRFRSEELVNLFSLHVPGRRTRLCNTLHVPRSRLSVSQRSLAYRIPSLYNSISTTNKIDFTYPQNLFFTNVVKKLTHKE